MYISFCFQLCQNAIFEPKLKALLIVTFFAPEDMVLTFRSEIA